jgi:hypothetical protein
LLGPDQVKLDRPIPGVDPLALDGKRLAPELFQSLETKHPARRLRPVLGCSACGILGNWQGWLPALTAVRRAVSIPLRNDVG